MPGSNAMGGAATPVQAYPSPSNAGGIPTPQPPPANSAGGMTPTRGGGQNGSDWWSMNGQDPGGMMFFGLPQGTEEAFGAAPAGFNATLQRGAGRKGRMAAVQTMYQGLTGGGGGSWGF